MHLQLRSRGSTYVAASASVLSLFSGLFYILTTPAIHTYVHAREIVLQSKLRMATCRELRSQGTCLTDEKERGMVKYAVR